MVDVGCKSSPNRCYTRLQRLFFAQFGSQEYSHKGRKVHISEPLPVNLLDADVFIEV